MKRLLIFGLALLPLAAFRATADPPPPVERPPAIGQFEDGIVQLADTARPWLVRIACHFRFGEETQADFFVSNEFSGVVLTVDGYVVTVGSAVRGARKVEVVLEDGTEYPAEVRGIDDPTNLALIKFDPGALKLTAARFGDSDTIKPGSFVLTLGNPFGLKGSVGHGIVAGTRRTVGGPFVAAYSGLIQITAPVNPGDAGGILLNSRGEVVGILSSTFQRATAIDVMEGLLDDFLQGIDWDEFLKKAKKEQQDLVPKDMKELVERLMQERKKQLLKMRGKSVHFSGQQLGAEGINFAIPANLVRRVTEELKEKGTVDRGYLGIRVAPVSAELRKHLELTPGLGVLVVSVGKGTPAADAGLEVFDVILSIDGKDVRDIESLSEIVSSHKQGETISIRLTRQKNEIEAKATLGKPKQEENK